MKKKIETIVGLFVISGNSIFTTTDLEEDLVVNAIFQKIEYIVTIQTSNKKYFSGKSLETAKMEDHNIIHNLINIIIKQAFRDTDLRQIGKQPRFFDVAKAVNIENSDLQACPGFRASAFNYTAGMTIVIDNISKFISNKTCLERIYEIYNDKFCKDFNSKIFSEFQYKSVIGIWGHKKAYIVHDIIFEKNPVTQCFIDFNGDVQSIAEYFLNTYKLKVTDKKQPLFLTKINGKDCHLCPEFCTVDGVP